jgi:hypothetical protein
MPWLVQGAIIASDSAGGCLDEWQDRDTDNALWRTLGAARTVNLATSLIPLSFLTLGRLADLGAETSLILGLHEEFHSTLFQMCAGRHRLQSSLLVLSPQWWYNGVVLYCVASPM